jgi:hypothetical protein
LTIISRYPPGASSNAGRTTKDPSPGEHIQGLNNGKTGGLPTGGPFFQNLDIGETFPAIPVRKTCGTFFVWSGAIEDQFPVFGKFRNHGLKLIKTHRPLQVMCLEFFITGIRTHQECISRLYPGPYFTCRHPRNICHDLPPFNEFSVSKDFKINAVKFKQPDCITDRWELSGSP